MRIIHEPENLVFNVDTEKGDRYTISMTCKEFGKMPFEHRAERMAARFERKTGEKVKKIWFISGHTFCRIYPDNEMKYLTPYYLFT